MLDSSWPAGIASAREERSVRADAPTLELRVSRRPRRIARSVSIYKMIRDGDDTGEGAQVVSGVTAATA